MSMFKKKETFWADKGDKKSKNELLGFFEAEKTTVRTKSPAPAVCNDCGKEKCWCSYAEQYEYQESY